MLRKWWRKKKMDYYLAMMHRCNKAVQKSITADDIFHWAARTYYYADKAVALCKEGES